MYKKASEKLGMERALFQKGAFGDDETTIIDEDKKVSPEDIEQLLKQGAFACLDEDRDTDDENSLKMNIDDILMSRGKKKDHKKGGHHLFKSTFNVEGKKSGKNSKSKPDTNDPNFWEKCGIPFDGYNAK